MALALFVSCKDSPTSSGGTGNPANTMTGTVDGLDLGATSVTVQKSATRLFIVGSGGFRTVTLNLSMPSGPGEVHLFIDDGANSALVAEGSPPNNPVWSTATVPRDTSAAQFSIVNFVSVSSTGASGAYYLKTGPAVNNAIGVRYATGTFSVKF